MPSVTTMTEFCKQWAIGESKSSLKSIRLASFWVCLHLKVEGGYHFMSVSQSSKLTDSLVPKRKSLWLRKTANTWPTESETSNGQRIYRVHTTFQTRNAQRLSREQSQAALGVLDIRHCSHGIDVCLKRQFAHCHSRLNLQDQTIIVKKKRKFSDTYTCT